MTKTIFNDRIMTGTLIGLISNIPKQILDFILYKNGFSQFFCWHVTGGTLISEKWLDTVNGVVIGAAMDFLFAGFLGVLMVYFLYVFGQEKYLFIKGVLFSILIWALLCMMVIDLRVSMYATLTDPWHAYHSFLDHGLWGVTAAYLIVKYGKSTVIPSAWKKINKG